MNTARLRDGMRIVGAIAAKDIVDAVKNRVVLSILLSVLILGAAGQALPLLLRLSPDHRIVVYDPGRSQVVSALKRSEGVQLDAVGSQPEMEQSVAEDIGAVLGVAIPATWEEDTRAGSPPALDGYVAHWVTTAEAAELRAFFEERLSTLAGRPVAIDLEGHRVLPTAEAGGQPFLVSMWLVTAIVVICSAVVPLLIAEERETHTLDALLVSPAGAGQVVAGKAVAGTVYGLAAAGLVLTINARMVVHWPAAAAAVICGTFFAVAVGLLLGSLFDNVPTMNLWLGLILMALIGPVLLADLSLPGLPPAIRTILGWVPTAITARAVRASFAASVAGSDLALGLAAVLAAALLVIAVVSWRLRKMDR